MRLTTEEYCNQCFDYLNQYIEGVQNNHIIAGQYIKKAVLRYQDCIKNPKYIYRKEKVNKVFAFFSFLNIEHKNNYNQLILLPWQCFMINFIFGLYYADNIEKRVIREVLLFCGRKNGKTALSSALVLYGMTGDGISNPQSLLLSNTSQQSTIALNMAKDIIVHTPQLRKRLRSQRSRIIYNDIEKQGFAQIMSTVDADRLTGYSPSLTLLDETHAWTDNKIFQAIKTGVVSRVNPLIIMISTAGNKLNGFLQDYVRYHKNIFDGGIEDENSLGLLYEPDPNDDLANTNNWGKSNPSLTYINSLDDLKIAFKQAQFSYADKYAFLTMNLNIFVDTPDTWIPEEYLLPLFEDFDESLLYGKDCHIGMDLSKTTDLSSIVLYIHGDDISYAIPYFWMANMENNMIRPNGRDLFPWIEDGWITKCQSKTIDLDMIYDKIIELSTKFNIVSVQYDPYNSPVLVSKLKDYGINCEKFQQNASKFNPCLKLLEEKVYNKTLKMKNPCLLWNFSNVQLWIDNNANIKIVKNKQNDSVDGVVALGMAIGSWIQATYGDEIMGINSYINSNK